MRARHVPVWLVMSLACAAMAQDARRTEPGAGSAGDTTPIIRPQLQAGDEWPYRRTTGRNSHVLRQSVTGVSEQGIALRSEQPGSGESSTTVHDRDWGLLGSGFNDYRPALAYYAFPLYSGKRWGIDSAVGNFGAGQTGRMKGEGRAVGWESVTVPAGSFFTLRIDLVIETSDPGDPKRRINVRESHWYSREVMRPVRVESETVVGDEAPRVETVELLSYRLE